MSDPKDGKLTEQQRPCRRTAVPPEMDFEPVPLPDQAAEPGTKDADAPPAQSGPTKKGEKPTEGAGKDEPVHHTGAVPPKV
ncbi:hypothetical protein [Sinorhizobium meliloti]|uniref:hypothetical protein n=1 Tax=Rhizobium meliloti TaxID=382 RepID=UPI000B5A8FD1|nr:hypothetical protein [Sinorhizobium meliloti]ASJ62991.1 hypothetical protein SMB554_28680 [Sinorhizobium meliloti]MCK3787298.1 hypothetical protein [Sinorhizobium meliloti]MCK3792140.1 hypothetical protein [Sinorhizobium meliloti]MCK3798537.1 hypothetical protein [Sinorhizobium meliloti]MDW9633877.1 hypothetical protein [Sinorhizobium meliloti]